MITPPDGLNVWLNHTTAITDKLKMQHPHVYLTRISQGFVIPDAWEKKHTPPPKHSNEALLFRREILMHAGEHACWYARTLIPESTYLKEATRFARLETESLGQIIWSTAEIQRQKMQQFCFDHTTLYHAYLKRVEALQLDASPLWGRLSMFQINNTLPFYLLEIFLPELKHYYEYPSSHPI